MNFQNKLKHEWQRIVTQNKRILFQKGIDELEKLHETISKDVDRGIFTHKGGHDAYKEARRIRDDNFKTLPEIYGMQVRRMVFYGRSNSFL